MSYNTKCVDCGLDTIAEGEWYMVHDQVWQQAWGSLEFTGPGQQILCIGCLQNRIGRRLTSADFTDAPVNDHGDDGNLHASTCLAALGGHESFDGTEPMCRRPTS